MKKYILLACIIGIMGCQSDSITNKNSEASVVTSMASPSTGFSLPPITYATVGSTLQLTYLQNGSPLNPTAVIWQSSDVNIATVDSTGFVTLLQGNPGLWPRTTAQVIISGTRRAKGSQPVPAVIIIHWPFVHNSSVSFSGCVDNGDGTDSCLAIIDFDVSIDSLGTIPSSNWLSSWILWFNFVGQQQNFVAQNTVTDGSGHSHATFLFRGPYGQYLIPNMCSTPGVDVEAIGTSVGQVQGIASNSPCWSAPAIRLP